MAEANAAEKKKNGNGATVVSISNGDKTAHPEANGTKAEKKKRKKKGGKGILFVIMLLLLAIAFVVATFIFDLFGLRTQFFSFVHGLDPEYRSVEVFKYELDEREKQLNELEASLAAQQQQLAEYSEELAEQEAYITDLELSSNPVYRPPVNEEDQAYMQNIGKIYAAMDAEAAAKIMVKLYSIEDMAAIIYYMPQAGAAAILEQMDAGTAADITDQLLHD